MSELKTKANNTSVTEFIKSVENEQRQKDCKTMLALMKKITGKKAVMWGDSMVGFGKYHYKYASGREGDWFLTGFSPRKQNFTLYIMSGFSSYDDLMSKLGKYKTGRSCLYVKKLDDIDLNVWTQMIGESIEYLNNIYECK